MLLNIASLLILAGTLLITSPCCSERITGGHPRGSIPYPKTMVLADPENPGQNVTVFMYSATEVQPRFNPAADIKFYISKEGQSSPSLIDLKKVEAGDWYIDPEGQWYFGVHGWLGSYVDSPIISELVKGSLVQKGLAKKDKIHLIGFSLGGHVVGFVGKNIMSKYNWKLKKITGLDPAGPQFSDEPVSGRIDSTDAEYVEIFHTCGGFLGIWEPHGLVDVYVNAGKRSQPGCGWDIDGMDFPQFLSFIESSIALNRAANLQPILRDCSHQFAKRTYSGYTKLSMRSYRCTSFADFASGHCDDDLQTYCEVGFKYPNCKEGVYHLDTTRYFN